MQSESCHLLPTNTSNLYSQIRYDLPRKEFKHIDQNSIPQAPFPCGFLLYASPDQGHLLTKTCVFPCKGGYSTDAQERRKLLDLSPLWGNQQNPGNMCEHMGKPRISQHFTMESQAPGPHDGPQVVQHVLLGQKAMDTVDAKACHGAPGPGSGHRCRLRKRRRPTKPSWALQGLHGVLLLGRKCGQHISILYHTVPPQLSQSQD